MKHLTLFATLTLLPTLAFAEEAKPEAKPAPQPKTEQAQNPKILLKTNKGDITLELDADKAPISTKNFLSYVAKKHYDGTVFHRVMSNFMIQGGGFDKSYKQKATDKPIANESNNGLKNLRGTVAMARTADPNSATAQFYINVVDNSPLDGGYAVFGKVISGMDVVDKIKAVPTTTSTLTMNHPVTGQAIQAPAENVPTEPVIIESATLIK